jgi:hypothetical protein
MVGLRIAKLFPILCFLALTLHAFVDNVGTLSWDDADYLRVSSCFSHLTLDTPNINLVDCEKMIYKAPIFVHIGILSGIFALPIHWFGTLGYIELIQISMVSLLLLQLIVLYLICRLFSNSLDRILILIFAILFFYDSFYLFMTDTLASLLAAYSIAHFIKSYARQDFSFRNFMIQLVIATLAVGIRTTCFPLFALVAILWFKTWRMNRGRRPLLFQVAAIYSLLFWFLFAFVWQSVIPTAISMAFGSQSNYFQEWVEKSGINLWDFTVEKYRLPTISVMLFLILKFKSIRVSSALLLGLIPIILMLFIFFIVSDNHDPRFLLWPLFALSIFSVCSASEFAKQESSVRPELVRILAFSPIFVWSILLVLPNQTFGLEKSNAVYIALPQSGNVCPLSDSPNLNVSKILLIDSLYGQTKNLNTRIINLPDSAMNGKAPSEVLKISETCSVAYYEAEVKSGTTKNEYLDLLIADFNIRGKKIDVDMPNLVLFIL